MNPGIYLHPCQRFLCRAYTKSTVRTRRRCLNHSACPAPGRENLSAVEGALPLEIQRTVRGCFYSGTYSRTSRKNPSADKTCDLKFGKRRLVHSAVFRYCTPGATVFFFDNSICSLHNLASTGIKNRSDEFCAKSWIGLRI